MIYETNELYHYGVKGMKWGHRKAYRDAVKTARNNMYSKYDKAENSHDDRVTSINRKYGQLGYNLEGKNARMKFSQKRAYNKEINNAWKDYTKENDRARAEFKQAKKEAKKERKANDKVVDNKIKQEYKQIRRQTSFKDKLMYSDATRKKAAKYVVDRNMSVSDATKKAKGEAWVNTAIIGAGLATMAVTAATYNKLNRF